MGDSRKIRRLLYSSRSISWKGTGQFDSTVSRDLLVTQAVRPEERFLIEGTQAERTRNVSK